MMLCFQEVWNMDMDKAREWLERWLKEAYAAAIEAQTK
jgi:hypothetical protein